MKKRRVIAWLEDINIVCHYINEEDLEFEVELEFEDEDFDTHKLILKGSIKLPRITLYIEKGGDEP